MRKACHSAAQHAPAELRAAALGECNRAHRREAARRLQQELAGAVGMSPTVPSHKAQAPGGVGIGGGVFSSAIERKMSGAAIPTFMATSGFRSTPDCKYACERPPPRSGEMIKGNQYQKSRRFGLFAFTIFFSSRSPKTCPARAPTAAKITCSLKIHLTSVDFETRREVSAPPTLCDPNDARL
jgi:hypothetical protein